MPSPIDFNPAFRRALELMEKTQQSVFITGRAGTGKSTLLKHFRDTTKKNAVVLAPTGVAAVNIGGQTVHSFFGFKPNITLDKVKKVKADWGKAELYKELETLVIDEVSMVRADLLDCVDKFLRLNGPKKQLPFGGVQMIFIGDLYQLPPVTAGAEEAAFREHYQSPYFFSAHVISPRQQTLTASDPFKFELIELEKIYRQSDERFIRLLNAIRNNTADSAVFSALNERINPVFAPPSDVFYITLTTTNRLADEINAAEIRRLKGREYVFRGQARGEFDEKYLPTDPELHLKAGAQIMLLNNDSQGRWINGTIGEIVAILAAADDAPATLRVKLETGATVEVAPFRWDIYEFTFNRSAGRIESESVGSFTQYPVRLAWAVTIHKSQGKTFNNVVVDIGRGTFSPGQLYVALSRCTSLEGLVLKRPIAQKHVWLDWKVVKFITSFQYQKSAAALSTNDKVDLIKSAIKHKQTLKITYLKARDEKSRRAIIPQRVGQMEYEGKPFLGVEAYCLERKDDRVFRVDRILELEAVK